MQLLIDVSDIHAYRERCKAWTTKRMEHLINSGVIDQRTLALDKTRTLAVLAEFDKNNPYPTIIPAGV